MQIKNVDLDNIFKPKKTKNINETSLGLFYVNDIHGEIKHISKVKAAHDIFVKENTQNPSMTLAAGDCILGADIARNNLFVKLFNKMKLDVLALGNHEFSGGSKKLAQNLENAEFKAVSANLEIDDENPLKKLLENKKLVKSAVFMKGGKKFAVIGASPVDSYIGQNNDKGVRPLNLEKTVNAINEEAKMLEKQGIDKIILCSHLGYGEIGDLKIARETEGVDIIIGGHSHIAIDGVNKDNSTGENTLNLVKSKRNEPVILTQGGKLNEKVGFLNVVFDEKGVLKEDSIENKLISTDCFEESAETNEMVTHDLGEKVFLTRVKKSYYPKSAYEERVQENPLQNLYGDALLKAGKTEIALFGSATVRGGMDKELTNYDIKYTTLPFNSNIVKTEIKEKDLIKLLNKYAFAVVKKMPRSQVVRCSGMNYTINKNPITLKNGETSYVSDIQIGDRKIDLNDLSDNKISATINEYILFSSKTVVENFSLKKEIIGKEQDIFTDYLKTLDEIDYSENENRITIKDC